MLRANCRHDNPQGYQFCGSCGQPPFSPTHETAVFSQAAPPAATDNARAGMRTVPRQPGPAERHEPPPRRRAQHEIPHEDMTRYLSAAVTFDDSLAAQLIENVLEEPHRAIAATPGVNLATVLRYALAANRRRPSGTSCCSSTWP